MIGFNYFPSVARIFLSR